MGIAVSEDHLTLAGVVRDFAEKHELRAEARALLEGATEQRPEFWDDMAELWVARAPSA